MADLTRPIQNARRAKYGRSAEESAPKGKYIKTAQFMHGKVETRQKSISLHVDVCKFCFCSAPSSVAKNETFLALY